MSRATGIRFCLTIPPLLPRSVSIVKIVNRIFSPVPFLPVPPIQAINHLLLGASEILEVFKRVERGNVEISTARRRRREKRNGERGGERRKEGGRDIENSYFYPILPRNITNPVRRRNLSKSTTNPLARDHRLPVTGR